MTTVALLAGFSGGGYQVTRSLRFRQSASAYLSRTNTSSPTNAKLGTLSMWVKRGSLATGNSQYLMETGTGTSNNTHFQLFFDTSNNINAGQYSETPFTNTSVVFRDPSAWYHFAITYDSTQATAANRFKLYVNNQLLTSSTTISQNNEWAILQAGQLLNIGRHTSVARHFDGYIAEMYIIDGQALTPSSFGYFDLYGVWQPKKYNGTYGTNGFYLPFGNNTSLEALGYDNSNPNPELITNGMFVSNVTGWTVAPGVGGTPSITWQSNHTARIANAANNGTLYYQAISTVIGQTYYAEAYVVAASIGGTTRTISIQKADDTSKTINAATVASVTQASVPAGLQGTFTATATTTYIFINVDILGAGTTGADITQVSVSLGGYKNSWNPFNLSITSGSTYDSMIDSPTPYADGSTNRGNYAVMNPLTTYSTVPTNGNLNLSVSNNTGGGIVSSVALPTTGKFYWEVTANLTSGGTNTNGPYIGIIPSTYNPKTGSAAVAPTTGYFYLGDGTKYVTGTGSAYGSTWTDSTANTYVIGVAYDAGGGTITFYRNNTSQGTLASSIPASGYVAISGNSQGSAGACSLIYNFGQQPFTYTPPTGYTALNTFNLPAPSVPYGAPYMNAITYTGYGPLVPSGLGILPKRNASTQNVSKSLRFRASASAYLNRTPASAGSQTTWTWSGWIKRGVDPVTASAIMHAGTSTANETMIMFDTNSFRLYNDAASVANMNLVSTPIYRDPSAWYHFVVAYNSTQATSTNRVSMYVNGVQITSFSTATYPAQNQTTVLNSAVAHAIGERRPSGDLIFDGYMAEVNFIDGQALTPSSFGQTNSDGIWVPKAYTGTYGTNGFYLPFTNTTSTTTLVADSSGNGNNWTPNNISLTAGTTYDSMVDSPTDYTSAGNYAVMNPLDVGSSGAPTITQANLNVATPVSGFGNSRSTIGVSSGKWYWEVTAVSATNNVYMIGVSNSSATMTNYFGSDANGWGYFGNNGQKYNSGSGTAYGATYTANDVIGVALDMDAGTLTFYKNGTSQGTAFTGLTGTLFPAISDGNGTTDSATMNVNFGQRPFSYSAPSGYSTLNTYNLTAPSKTWFSSANNSGNASATAYPDFVWIKARSSAQNHSLNDTVRGPTLNLITNNANTEAGASTMFSVNKYGLTLGNDASVNSSSYTDVMWGWQGGQGTTSTNTSGTITSTVSASTTSGFSIISYTGNFTAGATVGHGLGAVPSMIIVKTRTQTLVDWIVYHVSLGNTKGLYMDTGAATTSAIFWNNTTPTSSVITLGAGAQSNGNAQNMIAYCWAAITGYSAFGSYTGNGSTDGPFVYLGFRPRFFMVKRTDATESWIMVDTTRDAYNPEQAWLYPNLSNSEATGTSLGDALSNGFKLRSTVSGGNISGGTYIYAAFAENPFNMSRAR